MGSRKELTAEWIAEEMQRVIGSYPKEEIQNTMPVILLFMVREMGLENLIPQVRRAAENVLLKAGVNDRLSPDEIRATVKAYLATLRPNEEMLRRIKEIFDTHYAFMAEGKKADYRRLVDEGDLKLPAKVGAARPRGALSLDNFRIARRI